MIVASDDVDVAVPVTVEEERNVDVEEAVFDRSRDITIYVLW